MYIIYHIYYIIFIILVYTYIYISYYIIYIYIYICIMICFSICLQKCKTLSNLLKYKQLYIDFHRLTNYNTRHTQNTTLRLNKSVFSPI